MNIFATKSFLLKLLRIPKTLKYIYVIELKLTNNGGKTAAEKQIKSNLYTEPFKADKRKVIAQAIELDHMGKEMVDWKEVK